jgi:hypothetical protein
MTKRRQLLRSASTAKAKTADRKRTPETRNNDHGDVLSQGASTTACRQITFDDGPSRKRLHKMRHLFKSPELESSELRLDMELYKLAYLRVAYYKTLGLTKGQRREV